MVTRLDVGFIVNGVEHFTEDNGRVFEYSLALRDVLGGIDRSSVLRKVHFDRALCRQGSIQAFDAAFLEENFRFIVLASCHLCRFTEPEFSKN